MEKGAGGPLVGGRYEPRGVDRVRFGTRLERNLRDELIARASESNRSVTGCITDAIRDYLKATS